MVVISIGGSLLAPEKINIRFLKQLKEIVKNHRQNFIFVVGGGAIARMYQKAGRKFGLTDDELDWLGIYATYLNAKLVASALGADLITKEPKSIRKRLVVSSGWLPGCSTDYDAVVLAIKSKSFVVNLTNVPFVFDKDPKKPSAKPLKKLTWDEYLNIVGTVWKPGMHVPFDPVAAKLAKKHKIKVIITKGLKNFEKILDGKRFRGTVIQP